MKYKSLCPCLLLMGVCLAVPVLVSAKGLPYCGESWNPGNPLIHKVQHPFIENRGGPDDTRGMAWHRESSSSENYNAFRDRYSDSFTKTDDNDLGPSINIPRSVEGESRSVNPWWDRRSLGDPMVKELSNMDAGISGGYSGSGSLGR